MRYWNDPPTRKDDRHKARIHMCEIGRCRVCNAFLACVCYTSGGRPQSYCSNRCRQAGYRRRKMGKPEADDDS